MTFLNEKDLSLQLGDVKSLHKGSLELRTMLGIRKPSKLETALQSEIKSGEFGIKYKLLPNVSGFQVVLGSFNPLLASFGLQTRFGSTKRALEGRNRRNNRYLTYMYYRLLTSRSNPRVYWRIAELLIMRSTVYLVACTHHQNKSLYRTFTFERESKLLARINQLRGYHNPMLQSFRDGKIQGSTLMDPLIKYFRIYLPKITDTGSTYRPLGVPTVAWRIFASMWLLPLNGFCHIDESQQGFVPKRGTLTAWKQVMSLVLPARNIYELDFKGYFPSVNASAVSGHLKSLGMPSQITDYFIEMGITPPDLQGLDPTKLDESNSMIKHELDAIGVLRLNPQAVFKLPDFCVDSEGNYIGYVLKDYISRITNSETSRDALFDEIGSAFGYSRVEIQQYLYETLYEYYQYQVVMGEIFSPMSEGLQSHASTEAVSTDDAGKSHAYKVVKTPFVEGLPQGSSLSPFLSVVYMNHFMGNLAKEFPDIKYLAYADDVIFYSENDVMFDQFIESFDYICEAYGLKVSHNKSQISKLSGVWQKPRLKFLGIVYDTIEDILYSETRSGRSMIWDFADLTSISKLLHDPKTRFIGGIPVNLRAVTGTHAFMYTYFLLSSLNKSIFSLDYLEQTNSFNLQSKKFVKRFLQFRSIELQTVGKYWSTSQELQILYKYLITSLHDVLSYMSNIDITKGLTPTSTIFNGVYAGLIQSRLYIGSKVIPKLNTRSGRQTFKLQWKDEDRKIDYSKPGTLAHILRSSLGTSINVFNGSSIATYELVRYMTAKQQGLEYSVGLQSQIGWTAFFEKQKLYNSLRP